MARARVHGVLMVRDAVDVVRVCILHHLTAGCERITVVDNGSSDGTAEVLRRLAKRVPLRYTIDAGPFRQGEVFTELTREAAREGVDWVVPLGADEFWLTARPLPELLADRADDAVAVTVTHFVQRRSQRRLTPAALVTMTARAARSLDTSAGIPLVKRREAAWVERRPPTRILLRAGAEVTVGHGGHDAAGLAGEPRPTSEIEILHAPLRAPRALAIKAEAGRRAAERNPKGDESWHLLRWAELDDRGELDAEWRANSFEDGVLDVYGTPRPVVEDLRLREIVQPWIRKPVAQAFARATGRSY